MEQRELTLAPESVGLRLDRWLGMPCMGQKIVSAA